MNYLNKELSLVLKQLNFNIPVAHCYLHNKQDEYTFELFPYLLGISGVIGDIFEYVKSKNRFNIHFINNEQQVLFDYNQDIKKLLVEMLHGEQYREDEKCLNMYVDSKTFYSWSVEELEAQKLLPNYNDGDFEFGVYQDVISAPTIDQVLKWLRDTYNCHVEVTYYGDDIKELKDIKYSVEINYYGKHFEIPITEDADVTEIGFDTYEGALEFGITKTLELIKNGNK